MSMNFPYFRTFFIMSLKNQIRCNRGSEPLIFISFFHLFRTTGYNPLFPFLSFAS